MNKFAWNIFIVAIIFSFIKCSTDVNPIYNDLIGTWKIDSTRIDGNRVFKSRLQTLILKKDSTYTLTFAEGDILDIQKGTFILIMKRGLELPILTLRPEAGKMDSLIIVSITPRSFRASQEAKLLNETGESKVYSISKYFSKDK